MEALKNSSSKTLDELNYEERVRDIPLFTFLIVLCLSGIAGNSLVLYIFKKTYTRSTFRLFVIFLSGVDLFTNTVAIPLEIVTLVFDYKNNIQWLCKLYPFFLTCPTITSILLLLAIATDRYRKVCTPFSWQVSYRAARNIFISAVSLSVGFSTMRPVVFGVRTSKHIVYNLTIFECEVTEAMAETPLPMINNIIFALIFIGSLSAITVLYCCIAVRVKQQMKRKHQMFGGKAKNKVDVSNTLEERKKTNQDGQDNKTPALNKTVTLDSASKDKSSEKKQEKFENDANLKDTKLTTKSKQQTSSNRATLVMVLVTSVFFISFVPSVSLLVVRALDTGSTDSLSSFERSVYKFFFRFYLLNCVINPVIYGIFDPNFRNSCKTLFTCRSM